MTTNNTYNFSTDNGVPIQIDGVECFKIYPNDMAFVEKATKVYKDAQSIQFDLDKKYKELNIDVDENGIPKDLSKVIELNNEQFNSIYSSLDSLLGDGVCNKIFKGRNDFNLLCDFLDFLSDVIAKNRNSSINKYKPNRAQRRAANKGIM